MFLVGTAVSATIDYFGDGVNALEKFPGILPVLIGAAVLYLLVFQSALIKRDTDEPTEDEPPDPSDNDQR